MSKASPQFTFSDLNEWVADGLLTPEQALSIRQRVESRGATADRVGGGQEQRSGLNLVTIAYYFGGFMILFAYTIFIGLRWATLGLDGQFAISLGTVVGLALIGVFLRWRGFGRASNLLLFAATGIVPLLVYTIERLTGIWPIDLPYYDFYHLIAPAWVGIEVVSILVAVAVIVWIRFPLVTLLIAFWSWYLSMDVVRLLSQAENWAWGDTEQTIGALVGLILVLVGVLLQLRTRRDYSLWFYLFGLLVLLTDLGALAIAHEGLLGVLFLILSLTIVAASVFLQRRVFLVFGALGVYGYVSYLAFHVFVDTLGFPFVLAAVGLFTVLSAVGYQKFVRPWLGRQLQARMLGTQVN